MNAEKKIFTVSQINRQVKKLLEENFPSIWIEGEISNYKLHSAGHMYFSLKDEEAQINAVMYKGMRSSLNFQPKDGMKVVVRGRLSCFVLRGQYQVIVSNIEPLGVGALQIAFEQLKLKLQKEGLFDRAHKKKIPVLPQKIGIVTSPTGAAIRDILSVIERRFANVHIIINPVRVQGKEAAPEIADAIIEFNRIMPDLDVIIVGRGGGSIEDLWPFNEEIVARAIYDSSIPIISAVGHEIDYTISDFVSDLRAPTPSAAAELVVINKEDMVKRIRLLSSKLGATLDYRLKLIEEKLVRIKSARPFRRPYEFFEQHQQDIDYYQEKVLSVFKGMLDIQAERVATIAGRLSALSPLAVLARGYSVVWKLPSKKILTSSDDVSAGDDIRVQLNKGRLLCNIKDIEE